jgi:hypothetical protein
LRKGWERRTYIVVSNDVDDLAWISVPSRLGEPTHYYLARITIWHEMRWKIGGFDHMAVGIGTNMFL